MKVKSRPRYLDLRSSYEALEVLKKIDCDPYGVESMLPKMFHHNVLLEGIKCNIANIIKQEMLSIGGDAAVSRFAVSCSVKETDCVIMGTEKQIKRLSDKISIQPLGLSNISKEIRELLANISRNTFTLKTKRREIVLGEKTEIMGILNVTPDSFSDGGLFKDTDSAVEYALKMVEEGADIVDVGGESARPGAAPICLDEEIARVIPVIKGLCKTSKIPVSIDTTKAEVARRAIEHGADIVNDISAMTFDSQMANAVASAEAAIILMHMRGTPKDMQKGNLSYRSLRGEIIDFLEGRIEECRMAGISSDHIMIDPGIGFSKTQEDSMRLIKYLSEFKVLGRPILMGPSRKSFIGKITGGTPTERMEGTAAAVTAAIMNGANVVRVHDVRVMKKVAAMADAILRA
jgi:dihydropteroate synthase